MYFVAVDQRDEAGWQTWKILPAIPLRVNNFLRKYQKYVCYQDDIFMVEHSLVVPFQFGSTGRKKFKYPNMIK